MTFVTAHVRVDPEVLGEQRDSLEAILQFEDIPAHESTALMSVIRLLDSIIDEEN